MTTVETLSAKLETTADKQAHRAALVAVLGNGAEWEYRGEVVDLKEGKCACGHHIRYGYPVHHPDGRAVTLGSSCINVFEGVNPFALALLVAAVQSTEQKIADAKKAAAKAAKDEQAGILAARFNAAKQAVFARYSSFPRYHAPRPLYDAVEGYNRLPRKIPEYQRVGDLIRWLTQWTPKWEALV